MAIIQTCRIVGYCIVGSMAVTSEIGEIRNVEKREEIETFFNDTIDMFFAITAKEDARSQELRAKGLGEMDSLHLAVAETVGADVLLTTDAQFIQTCAKKNLSGVRVINPLNFLPEVTK